MCVTINSEEGAASWEKLPSGQHLSWALQVEFDLAEEGGHSRQGKKCDQSS